jgi:hypothetical protein
MNEGLPRLLLALTLLVAAIVFFFGIKDYFQQKNPKPVTSPSTPDVVVPNTVDVQKKTTSLKTRRARISATEADAHGGTQAAADDTVKPLIRKDSANSGAKEIVANNSALNPVTAAHDDQETAMGSNNNGVRGELQPMKASKGSLPDLSAPKCVPLPNVTSPADVDAPYYQNWAREYSCYELIQAVAAASN